jgi:uncharacterized protein YdeI (YjbR/CyaY-like superfamily)
VTIAVADKRIRTLDVANRRAWRTWLRTHHASESEIWLVFHKRHTAKSQMTYDDAVEEALCFGWIDSLVRRLDDDRYARKFTPRKPDSRWSTANRRRYAALAARGALAAPGRERPPTSRSGDAPPRRHWSLPAYVKEALKADARAWQHFERLAPSYQQAYVGWIDSAKREATKMRRLREAIELLAAGKKLGLK